MAGLLLFMVGLLPFMAPAYAAAIAILMYFGIKLYVGRRRRAIERGVGQGLCLDCGAKVTGGACPDCRGTQA